MAALTTVKRSGMISSNRYGKLRPAWGGSMRLNQWQRAGIVVSVVWAVLGGLWGLSAEGIL